MTRPRMTRLWWRTLMVEVRASLHGLEGSAAAISSAGLRLAKERRGNSRIAPTLECGRHSSGFARAAGRAAALHSAHVVAGWAVRGGPPRLEWRSLFAPTRTEKGDERKRQANHEGPSSRVRKAGHFLLVRKVCRQEATRGKKVGREVRFDVTA
jgi:hypothetical protein